MKIFMTGASGFLGRSITSHLLKQNHCISALLLEDDQLEEKDGLDIVRGNITCSDSLQGLMVGHDAVIHLAGAVGYGQSWSNCIKLNTEGTINVVNEAIHSGVRRFIQMSSISVYGRKADVVVTENSPKVKIGDPYGDTKIDAENYLLEKQKKGLIDLTLIRPTMIYGPGDRLFLPKVIENLKSGNARIIGSGKNNVDLIHVDDVAEFVSLVLSNKGSIGQAYNLSNNKPVTWIEFLSLISEELKLAAPENHLPYWLALSLAWIMEMAARVTEKPPRLSRYAVRNVGRNYRYSVRKMRSELGFNPRVELLEGIREVLKQID